MRATFLHSKTGWLVACCSIQALYSLTASYSFLSRPFLVHHPLARSFVGPLLRRMHPFGESHLACANACISTGTAKSALAVSLLRFVSVLYFTRVGSQSPGRVAQHSTGIRGIGVSILACKPSQQSYRRLVSATAHNKAVQLEDPSKGPSVRHRRPGSRCVRPPRSSSSRALRPCHATRRLALQLAAVTGGSFTSSISGLWCHLRSHSPIAPSSLLSPKGG